MNKDRNKYVHSYSSIPAAATFFPMSAIVTGPTARPACPRTRTWRRSSPSQECEFYDERNFNLYSTVKC